MWVRHSLRTKIIGHVMNECGLLEKQDVTNDLKKYRMSIIMSIYKWVYINTEWVYNSSSHIQKLISTIKNTVDPFSNDLDKDELFNISTGTVATDNIADCLLNVQSKGEEFHEVSILLTYVKNKILKWHSCNYKEICLASYWEFLSKLDIDKVLAYPLTPVPLVLSHLDGSICKTEKALMQMFEKRSPSEPEERTDVIHDGFFCSIK